MGWGKGMKLELGAATEPELEKSYTGEQSELKPEVIELIYSWLVM